MAKKFSEDLKTLVGLAKRLAKVHEADALLVWPETDVDWDELRLDSGELTVVIASDQAENLASAIDAGIDVVQIDAFDAPIAERLSTALLEGVAQDILSPGAGVVAIFSAFRRGKIDTVSYIELDEHLGRLSVRDLRELETAVPVETLKAVLDLAVQVGREGREGKDIGTMFVVGDSRKVLASSHPVGFDAVRGYKRDDKNIRDKKIREAIKELTCLDGAFIISSDGTVEAACHMIDTGGVDVAISGGLGTRHWAAASITKKTSAIAITVSESGGKVRIFQNGDIMKTIEPLRRAMVWKRDKGVIDPLEQ